MITASTLYQTMVVASQSLRYLVVSNVFNTKSSTRVTNVN